MARILRWPRRRANGLMKSSSGCQQQCNDMRFLPGIMGIALVGALSGCAGYHVGPSTGQRAGDRTIQIVPFTNRTLEPRLSDAVTAALRREIQREGTYKLVTQMPGEVIVSGEIIRFERSEISFLPNDVITAQDYRMNFTAHVIARDRRTGRTLLDRDLTGVTLMRVGNDLPSVERQTLPLLAADLARQITAALADGVW